MLLPGAAFAGIVEVEPIGFPDDLIRGDLLLVEAGDVASVVPERELDTHKRSAGFAVVVGGSRLMTGAAALAGTAAYRVGAGLVAVAVPEGVLSVVQGALREAVFVALPETDAESGIAKIEITGVCGADYPIYTGALAQFAPPPLIPGHEIVAHVDRIGSAAAKRWGVKEGDRIVMEEYAPCGRCDYCLSGRYYICNGMKMEKMYGFTSLQVAPGLWGGYSEYVYLDQQALLHKLSAKVPREVAPFFVPLANGIRWAHLEGGVRIGRKHLLHDLDHAEILEDAIVGVQRQKPQPRHHRHPVDRLIVAQFSQTKGRNDAVKVALRLARDCYGQPGAKHAVGGKVGLVAAEQQIKAKGLADLVFAFKLGKADIVAKSGHGNGDLAILGHGGILRGRTKAMVWK